MTGTRPVVDFMFADFILDSVGEIINQIAKIQLHEQRPADRADPAPRLHRHRPFGGHASFGNYYPMYAHFPGLRVVVPSTPYDAKGLLKTALRSQRSRDFPGTPRASEHERPGARPAITRSNSAVPPLSSAGQRRHRCLPGPDGAPDAQGLRATRGPRASRSSSSTRGPSPRSTSTRSANRSPRPDGC